MKSLKIFVNEYNVSLYESALKADDFSKHNFKYTKGLLNSLIYHNDIKLGQKGNSGVFNSKDLDKSVIDDLQKLMDNIDTGKVNMQMFNDVIKDTNLKYTSFFKGQFSGYDDGTLKNKGNAFEIEFINDFSSIHKYELEKLLGYELNVSGIPSADGALNKKRPLVLDNDGYLYVTPKNIEDVGSYVTDVTVPLENNTKKLFLSLKWGKTVTFINCGINNKDGFPKEAFIEGNTNKIGKIGKHIIDMFHIDDEKLINTFNKNIYVGKADKNAPYDTIDVTEEVDKDRIYKFIQSVIGCGFVLVHKINDKVHYYKLMDINDLKNFIGNDIINVIVKYPINGNKKRINIYVETSNLEIEFNIRAKDGGFYPTHIMSDYKIK